MADTTTEVQNTPEVQITMREVKELGYGLAYPDKVDRRRKLSPINMAFKALRNGQAEYALKMVAGEIIPSGEDVEEVLLENLGVRDQKTRQKKVPRSNTREGKRYQDSKNTADSIRDYLENPQEEPPGPLLEMVYSYLASSPAFRELIFDKTGQINIQEAEAIAKTLLREPQVRAKIRELYVQRLDPAKRLDHEKEVFRLEQEVRRIMAELGEDIEQLIQDKKNEILNLHSQIQASAKFQNYQVLQAELDRLELERDAKIQEYERLTKIQKPTSQTQQDLLRVNGEISRLDAQVRAAKQNIINFQNDSNNKDLFDNISRLNQLKQELQALEQKRTAVDPERKRRLQQELAEKQAELSEARALLKAEQIKYAGEIQAIVPEAVKSYLDEAFKKGAEVLREEKKKEYDERLFRVKNKILARIGRKKRKRDGMFVPNKREAAKLLQRLLLPDGIDQLFSAQGELYLDVNHLKTTYNLTDEEAKIFIEQCQDPTYQREIALDVAKAVFADFVAQGGRLSKDVVMALTSTEWGKSLLDEGYNLLQERRAELEKWFGAGVIRWIDELREKKGWRIAEGVGKVALLILLFFILKGGVSAVGTLLPGR